MVIFAVGRQAEVFLEGGPLQRGANSILGKILVEEFMFLDEDGLGLIILITIVLIDDLLQDKKLVLTQGLHHDFPCLGNKLLEVLGFFYFLLFV